ncbi:condensin complex subunit 2/barren [Jimgerdemannia flammicorona]|uniref:Condensin complex subunit 2 n=1 Tax=Jimgerdemannia flammicorona TaxID=994334 RepID=A0A433Q1M0_9FUNG|nr:condensin complex subunit 2/barren [Jimgerdemannia flammicorona]
MLKVKKLELEFAVDPLFKKTSADFDEGGARGLLLNHLSVDPDGRIIFDAGDAKAEGDEEGEEEGGGEEEGMKEEGVKKEKEGEAMEVDGEDEGKGKKTEKGEEEEAKLIDVSKLKVKFLPNMDELLSYDICPSLKDFTFATDASELPFLRSHTDEDEDPTSIIANPVGDDDDDDDLGDYFGEDNGVSNADDDDSSIVVVAAPGTAAPFDPAVKSLKEKDYMMAMAGEENEMFSYFDSAFMRSWAGPEHWKMRRAVVKIDKPATAELVDGTEGDEGAAPTGAKKKREAFSVNFVGGEDVDEKVLFARAPKRRSIKLIETKEGGAKHLLPDDMNFSSKQLLRMFARPNFSVGNGRRRVGDFFGLVDCADYSLVRWWHGLCRSTRGNTPIRRRTHRCPLPYKHLLRAFSILDRIRVLLLSRIHNSSTFLVFFRILSSTDVQEEEEEVNEQFWADQVDAAPDGPEGQASGEADRADSPDLDLPFLFHDVDVDDDDDPFGDAEGDVDDIPVGGDSHGYGDNLIAASLRKVKPAYVNYAKTAKKVDVKKLKDNLWREMTVGNGTAAGAAAAQEDVPEDATVVGRQKFTEIVSGLDKVYPEKKRKDISVPFCFICLLHLANEKNLVIEKAGGDGLDDLIVMQDG